MLYHEGVREGFMRKGLANRFKAQQIQRSSVQAMEKAALRHKDGLIKPQVFGGRVLQGPAFTATPSCAEFLDFDSGETYTRCITMTNVSFGRCTFKVLPMADGVADIFEVSYQPPGHISAGMTCELHVTFTPKSNAPVDTTIPLLAETGKIDIPVKCRPKVAKVTVSDDIVDFGAPVALGESSCRQLVLKNEGALAV